MFFHESSSSKPHENNIRVIGNFFENSEKYSQVKVHHRYQRHPSGGKLAAGTAGVIDTCRTRKEL
jgi:hypothetical protein